MKDNRDPQTLGDELLRGLSNRRRRERVTALATETYDVMDANGHFSEAPYVEPTVLERYGDPVAQHEAKIEAGLAVRLP